METLQPERTKLGSFVTNHDPVLRKQDEDDAIYSKRPMSLRIEASRFLCLDRIASHVGMTRTTVAQEILEAAAWDVAKQYGLLPSEDDLVSCYDAPPMNLDQPEVA
jgi:hypothetical protein